MLAASRARWCAAARTQDRAASRATWTPAGAGYLVGAMRRLVPSLFALVVLGCGEAAPAPAMAPGAGAVGLARAAACGPCADELRMQRASAAGGAHPSP